ncbi:Membrane protein-like protein [uncultured delta proteobacterium]|uniref:Membrane protein-like protein n=1 Tax=uncultured delta proteobacterium TaxID=34034 RepID=A0A212KCP0_9DELT|nr:Membrane protein-like protein [uncultured delta proteobacterium]
MENQPLSPNADVSASPATRQAPCRVPEMSRAGLAGLRERGVFSRDAWEAAMDFCGFRPGAVEWRLYWQHILLLGGALFLVAGIIFFIAWNWGDMHHFARMALVGGIVAVTGLCAVWLGPDTNLGKVLLLSCGISVGPLLAVFGQTYQTGAELWELFRVWTAVLFALALAGRQAALWFTTWLAANIFVILWLGRSMDSPLEALGMFSLLPECVLGLALAVAAWECAAYNARRKERGGNVSRQQGWLQSRWLPRLLFFDLTVRLTVYLCLIIFDPYGIRHMLEFALPHYILPALALVVAGGSCYWHRKKTPDLFMLACLVSACAVLFASVLLRAEFLFEAGVGAIFIWGLIIVGLTAGVAAILLSLQRSMEGAEGKSPKQRPGTALMEFFAPARRVPGWDELRNHLAAAELLAADAPLPRQPEEKAAAASPWYVRTILAVGGWIAAVVFLVFMGLFLFMTLRIRDNEGATLLFASLIPLGVAFVCLRCPGIFLRNFGFSLALTGTAGACGGLGWMLEFGTFTPFLYAAVLIGLCYAMNSAPYRFLAALCIVQCVAAGIIYAGVGELHRWGGTGEAEWIFSYRRMLYVTVIWWAAVALALAVFRLREGAWRALPGGKHLEPFFAGAYGGMLVYLISALALQVGGMGDLRHLGLGNVYFPSAAYTVGLGAAVGLVYFVNALVAGGRTPFKGMFVIGCAALALPLGWYLPGAALAAFGLALSRYWGSLVMQGVTCAFLFAYMVYYYYFLGISLLHKSLLLAATGAVLLVLALCLDRFGPRVGTREERHA